MSREFKIIVKQKAEKKLLFLPHAVSRMISPERMISAWEVRKVVTEGEIIEEYPEDVRGHSCLVKGYGNKGRPVHVVCSPKEDYLAIITAYLPDSLLWEKDMKKRRRK